jgi:phosphate transport system substrate-binding protein
MLREEVMRRPEYIPTFSLCFLLICSLLFAGFCGKASAETIRINGSGSCLDMMKPVIAAYVKANPGVSILMKKPLGSDGAKRALLAGSLDIVLTSKPLKPEDTQQGAKLRVYGKTPLAIVTNKDVNIKNITTKELEDIYSGITRTWPDGSNIRVVTRPLEDVDTWILRKLSPVLDRAIPEFYRQRGMILGVTDPESNELVSKTKGSIGATGLTSLVTHTDLNVLSLNGVTPSPATLATGRYPLVKLIDIVTTSGIPATAQKFLDFLYSRKGRTIARKTGVLVTTKSGP